MGSGWIFLLELEDAPRPTDPARRQRHPSHYQVPPKSQPNRATLNALHQQANSFEIASRPKAPRSDPNSRFSETETRIDTHAVKFPPTTHSVRVDKLNTTYLPTNQDYRFLPTPSFAKPQHHHLFPSNLVPAQMNLESTVLTNPYSEFPIAPKSSTSIFLKRPRNYANNFFVQQRHL